jgi:hypothetical protein
MRLVILLCLSACLIGCQPKHEELKLQLIRLQSAVKTGVNPTDFSARVADLRTARKMAGRLPGKQVELYDVVENRCAACLLFWEDYQHPLYGQYRFGNAQQSTVRDLGLKIEADQSGNYNPRAAAMQSMAKLDQSIEEMLNQMK